MPTPADECTTVPDVIHLCWSWLYERKVSCRQFSPSPMTHAMLAFEYPGGWNDVKGSTAVTVLQFLLGGGGSFSAGGPGKHSE